MGIEDVVYHYDPNPEPEPEPGVGLGWIVLHDGHPGPAQACRVVMMLDTEGIGTIVQDGPLEPVTITDEPT